MSSIETNSDTTAPAERPRRRVDELLSKLAEQVGATFDASTVFGSPVEREGVTIVPVATARFGFGGGAGEDRAKDQDGAGGGAGGTIAAAGYIELKDGRSRFVPAIQPARMFALTLGALLAGLLIVRPYIRPPRPISLPWR
jgi:uncharacterized spore protein YtfJ